MGSRFSDQDHASYQENSPQSLLGAGWRPLYRELDPNFVWHLFSQDPWEFAQKSLQACSNVADALGRQDYAWWANLFNVFSENTLYDLGEFWNYITPPPSHPDRSFQDVISVETPIVQEVNRQAIPIDRVLNQFQEVTLFRILTVLKKPDRIVQNFFDRYFYYPVERFVSWDHLETSGLVSAYWSNQKIWLQIRPMGSSKRRFTLIAHDLSPWIEKATFNLAVMLSGYQSRVGQVQSAYLLSSFPEDVRAFTAQLQTRIQTQDQLALLVHGKPGTGKTAWTQAVAREILVPLGYVIFILDHEAVENFIPPPYLRKVCLIINEADNLARDRASESAQLNTRTEHVLSLLDGTLYRSIVDEERQQKSDQKFIVLMTCNTVQRLDPAILRKGRIDLTHEFIQLFI